VDQMIAKRRGEAETQRIRKQIFTAESPRRRGLMIVLGTSAPRRLRVIYSYSS
jgi:hypothetical protein